MPVYGEDGLPMSEAQLFSSLRDVSQISGQIEKAGTPLGLLTTDNRDNWSAAYQTLLPYNGAALKQIETSLFSVSLDRLVGDGGGDTDELSRSAAMALHGMGPDALSANRWYDKNLQFFVGRNGDNGIIHEHSTAEAVVHMVMTDHVLHCA